MCGEGQEQKAWERCVEGGKGIKPGRDVWRGQGQRA